MVCGEEKGPFKSKSRRVFVSLQIFEKDRGFPSSPRPDKLCVDWPITGHRGHIRDAKKRHHT